jgi:hypothetical protein
MMDESYFHSWVLTVQAQDKSGIICRNRGHIPDLTPLIGSMGI